MINLQNISLRRSPYAKAALLVLGLLFVAWLVYVFWPKGDKGIETPVVRIAKVSLQDMPVGTPQLLRVDVWFTPLVQ